MSYFLSVFKAQIASLFAVEANRLWCLQSLALSHSSHKVPLLRMQVQVHGSTQNNAESLNALKSMPLWLHQREAGTRGRPVSNPSFLGCSPGLRPQFPHLSSKVGLCLLQNGSILCFSILWADPRLPTPIPSAPASPSICLPSSVFLRQTLFNTFSEQKGRQGRESLLTSETDRPPERLCDSSEATQQLPHHHSASLSLPSKFLVSNCGCEGARPGVK